jgi:integrase
MTTRKLKPKEQEAEPYREEWPRIRTVALRGVDFYQVDGRPHYPRKTFSNLADARKQADKWANSRARYGTAGKYISERDASRFAEALEILSRKGAGIVEAARHYVAHLEAEERRSSSKLVSEALDEWKASYESKDRDVLSKREISSRAGIFKRHFGTFKLGELTPDKILAWIESYEAQPGKIASPQTRANLKTKFSQFLKFSKLKGWIENNPLEGIQIDRPPRAPVAILDLKQVRRILSAADASENRDIILPYAAVCLFAGLRPNSEAEQLEWKDVNFSTGDIHVRAETSKTREERFVPMESNLIAWLESCPIRHPGPIIGRIPSRFNQAWDRIKRLAGYKVGAEPEKGWPATAQDWPVDSMRHTFASMFLPVYKSRAELAERMGNSEKIIRQHYRRAIRPEVAREFWEIMPESKKRGKIIRMEGAA